MRGADILEQPAVLGLEPVEQRTHVLIGQELRQVVADDLAQMREQHRQVVDGHVAFALERLLRKSPGPNTPSCRRPARAPLRRAHRAGPVAGDDQDFADAQLLRRDHRAMDLDLVGLGGDAEDRRSA